MSTKPVKKSGNNPNLNRLYECGTVGKKPKVYGNNGKLEKCCKLAGE